METKLLDKVYSGGFKPSKLEVRIDGGKKLPKSWDCLFNADRGNILLPKVQMTIRDSRRVFTIGELMEKAGVELLPF